MSKERFASCSFNDFKDITELYRSASGAVYKATFKYDNKQYVLKEKRLPELGKKKDIMNEVKLLSQLRHANIVQCEGWFRDLHRDNTLFIVLEYCDGGDLDKMISQRRQIGPYFTEREIWYIFHQICSGVQHLHEHGIIHRDLKALNILVSKDQRHFKVSDLGVSRQVSEQTKMLNTFYGTPLYLSPEIIENKAYNEKTDIWSLGVLLYELCALVPPFRANSLMALAKVVMAGNYEPLDAQRYSRNMIKCVKWLLALDYRKRPSIVQVLDFVGERVRESAGYYGETLSPPGMVQGERERDMDEDSLDPSPKKRDRADSDDVTVSDSDGGDTEDEREAVHPVPHTTRPIGRERGSDSKAVPVLTLPVPPVQPQPVPPTVPPVPQSVPVPPTDKERERPSTASNKQRDAQRSPVPPRERERERPKTAVAGDRERERRSASPSPSRKHGRTKQREKDKQALDEEMVEIDPNRAAARVHKEMLRYRKLLQTRDFMQAALSLTAEHGANADSFNDVRERLRECQIHLQLLENALGQRDRDGERGKCFMPRGYAEK